MNTNTINTSEAPGVSNAGAIGNAQVLGRVAGVIGFALATAIGAQIAVPLPGTPVPMTLQTLAVVMAGITLGPRLGLLSMTLYVLLGSVGYHVFATGNWGLATVFGATGGYLIGFVLAQPVVGTIARPDARGWARITIAVGAATVVIFACGLLWLAVWSGGDLNQTLSWGLLPFVPGLILKSGLAIALGRIVLGRSRLRS